MKHTLVHVTYDSGAGQQAAGSRLWPWCGAGTRVVRTDVRPSRTPPAVSSRLLRNRDAGEECNVFKGCCNPTHDCVPLSDMPLPPLWERAGTCQTTKMANTGEQDRRPPWLRGSCLACVG